MKHKVFSCCISLLLSATVFAQKDLNPGTYAFITIENPSNFARKNVPVALKIDSLTAKIKKYKGQQIGIFDGSKEIFSQFDDLNFDGKADEVAFLVDLKPNGKVKLLVRTLPQNFVRPNFEKETYAQMIKKVKIGDRETMEKVTEASSDKDDMYNQMHHHGVAFESELMAYRLYFDKKHTVDIYGKIRPQLELAQTMWYPTDEQLAAGFGDDILKVGSSVGVGSFKPWDGKQAQHFDQITRRTQRIVAAGNLRSVVEIEVDGWQYQGKSINAKIRYTQYARHRDCEARVIFEPDFTDNLIFCTGVQRMPEEQFHTDNAGLVGIWGTGFPVNDTVKYAKQTVGLGVVVPAQYAKGQAEDKRNHLILLSNNGKQEIVYYLTAAAQKEKKGYQTAEDFFKYLDAWKQEMLNPVKISLSEK
ncbi:MAG: DUF4861 domain-containing protein [Prevotellaceae bacterium]|jgi:hypothetical protein|nr:DUF4861 domain-containing protein [Prevotellaceae bacterium]